MTRDEALSYAKAELKAAYDRAKKIGLKEKTRYIIVLEMAIKALEQEPCEDAISRQEVLYLVGDYDLSMGQVVRGIHALPSVTPQELKTGHWNDIPKYKDIAWQCSECEHFTTMKHNYCPNCGCRMFGTQESEDKE